MASSSTFNQSHSDGPLPLLELKRWMSEEVYLWIQEGDEKQQKIEKELEATAHSRLFGEYGSDSEDEDDDDENEIQSTTNKKRRNRVQGWSSSTQSPDGVGGFQPRTSLSAPLSGTQDTLGDDNDHRVEIVFVLSESYQGFGDILWSSARYLANTISNPTTCRELLSPLFGSSSEDSHSSGFQQHDSHHPLVGRSFLEVGAGAGVPSWAAMNCGAHVVCTDLSDTNRIRCMAECAERNYRRLEAGDETDALLLPQAATTRVCPHDWGSPVETVIQALNGSTKTTSNSSCDKEEEADQQKEQLFDVIVAADCCYMPWWHSELLDSIHGLLSEKGVAILSFCLHGNTDDSDVWKIVDRARDKGFGVEVLESQQLSPPKAGMESKQGLVHTVRLTKKHLPQE